MFKRLREKLHARKTARRFWTKLNEPKLARALIGVETALGVLAPEPGHTTLADPIAHLRAARRHLREYLKLS